MSETGYTIGFRQPLSTTSFEACELEITVNYLSVYTREWQFHGKSKELTDAFWLVLLIEHKVLHCYATNVVYIAAWLRENCTRLVASVQQTVDASKFPNRIIV